MHNFSSSLLISIISAHLNMSYSNRQFLGMRRPRYSYNTFIAIYISTTYVPAKFTAVQIKYELPE